MNAPGMTLLEVLVALAILSLVMVGVMASLASQASANTRSEERSGATAAAAQIVEQLRMDDPSLMPSSGASAPQMVTVGDRQYEVVTRYCTKSQYCGPEARHLLIEASYDGSKIYEIETVFTSMR